MLFDEANKVIIDTLNKTQAKAFVKFLNSEIIRHALDIQQAYDLIETVKKKFNLEV